MSDRIAARPTTYRGISMRSRLEATFAAFLDRSGLWWVYEPRAFGGRGGQYLPDFEIALHEESRDVLHWYAEVKPPISRDEVRAVRRQMRVIWESDPMAGLLLVTEARGLIDMAHWKTPDDSYVPLKWALCSRCESVTPWWRGYDERFFCQRCQYDGALAAFVNPLSHQFRSAA